MRGTSDVDELLATHPSETYMKVPATLRRTVATAAAVALLAGCSSSPGPDPQTERPTPSATSPVTVGGVTQSVTTLTIRVGEDASDLAVHPKTGDVYVTNGEDDTVSVIDAKTHRVTDTIAVGHEPGEIAVDTTTGLVYVANGGGAEDADEDQWTGSVTVINGETKQVVDTIVIGQGKWPTGLAVDPRTSSLFVANNADATVSVIDTDTNDVIETVRVERSPGDVAVNQAVGEAYVVNNNSGSVSVIDTRTREVKHTIRESGGGIALDPSTGRLFVANEGDGTVAVVDTTTHEVVKSVRVGGYGPFDVEIDPAAARAYVPGTQDGTMAVLDTNTLEIIERIAISGPAGSLIQGPVIRAATDSGYIIAGPRDVGVIARW